MNAKRRPSPYSKVGLTVAACYLVPQLMLLITGFWFPTSHGIEWFLLSAFSQWLLPMAQNVTHSLPCQMVIAAFYCTAIAYMGGALFERFYVGRNKPLIR